MPENIGQRLKGMDLIQTLNLLDNLEAKIGASGGRHYVLKGKSEDEEGYLTMQQIMDRLDKLQKTDPEVSSLAWKKIDKLNQKGNEALENADGFAQFRTWIRQFFGNLFSSNKETVIKEQTGKASNKLTAKEVEYFNNKILTTTPDGLATFFKQNDYDMRMLDLPAFKNLPAPFLQQFNNLILSDTEALRRIQKDKFIVPAEKWRACEFSQNFTPAQHVEKGKAHEAAGQHDMAAKCYLFATRIRGSTSIPEAIAGLNRVSANTTEPDKWQKLTNLAHDLHARPDNRPIHPETIYQQHILPFWDTVKSGQEQDKDCIKFVHEALRNQINSIGFADKIQGMNKLSRDFFSKLKALDSPPPNPKVTAASPPPRSDEPNVIPAATEVETKIEAEKEKPVTLYDIARDRLKALKKQQADGKSVSGEDLKRFYEGNISAAGLINQAYTDREVRLFVEEAVAFLLLPNNIIIMGSNDNEMTAYQTQLLTIQHNLPRT